MELIIMLIFIGAILYVLMKKGNTIDVKEVTEDPELPLIKKYYDILESCHNLGTISEEEYHFEKGYLDGRLTMIEQKIESPEMAEMRKGAEDFFNFADNMFRGSK